MTIKLKLKKDTKIQGSQVLRMAWLIGIRARSRSLLAGHGLLHISHKALESSGGIRKDLGHLQKCMGYDSCISLGPDMVSRSLFFFIYVSSLLLCQRTEPRPGLEEGDHLLKEHIGL